MKQHFKVLCKCGACGKTQTRRIDKLIAGETSCNIGLGNQCKGEINFPFSSDAQQAETNAFHVLSFINWIEFKGRADPLAVLTDSVVDDLSNWNESQDPQGMGWVSTKGKP